jgi:hypothetical protein
MIKPERPSAGREIVAGRNELNRWGLTAIEVLIVLGLLSLVLASTTAILMSQQRFYSRNADVAATRNAARTAAALLTAELRGVNPSGGGLYGFAPDSVAIRSTTGIGIVCGFSGSTLVLRRVSGVFGDLQTDSVLLFVEHEPDRASDDEWVVARIEATRPTTTPDCTDGAPPDNALTLDREVGGVRVGSPIRAFRPYVYRLYTGSDGRWWLGQRLRGGRIQPVTGPFAPPAQYGLRMEYITRLGAAALDPTAVALVRLSMKAQGRLRYPWRGQRSLYTDSVTTAVWLRGY